MQTIIEALRDVLGEADFYHVLYGSNQRGIMEQ